MNRVQTFLELAVKQGGSDLHLVSGEVPRIRINGALEPVRFRELSTEDMERLLAEVLTNPQRERLGRELSLDFAYAVAGLGRFRVNVYYHVRGIAAALRVVPDAVPLLDDLGLPPQVKELVRQPKGLTLVTGPTGSGKSTTLASIVDYLNRDRRGHIITIEDPIEFVHQFRSSVVTQREIGAHAPSFTEALRDAVREDPDTILVGELRDVETISLALTAAETGIQVLGTLHTNGAGRCVDRIINVFPARRQDQVRAMLADSLRLVVSQQLVRLADGSARKLVADVLVNTTAAASMIRSGNTHKLGTIMQSGGRQGMQLLDNVLLELLRSETITGEEAWEHAVDKAPFERHLGLEGSGMMIPLLVLAIVGVAAGAVAGFAMARRQPGDRRKHLTAVRTLMALADAGDVLTRGHSYRVSRLSTRLGRHLRIDANALEELEYAALVHDIGRVAIRADVLQKPGPLSADERDLVQTHPVVGHEIVRGLGFYPGAAEIVLSHHEQPDGKGYPRGLSGEAIPLAARIIMVAAALEAMTVDRPYRRGMKPAVAMAEIARHAGTQFDADVVAALTALHADGTLYDDLDPDELARLTHRWSPSGVDEELFERMAGRKQA